MEDMGGLATKMETPLPVSIRRSRRRIQRSVSSGARIDFRARPCPCVWWP